MLPGCKTLYSVLSLLFPFKPCHSAMWFSPELVILTTRSGWFTLPFSDSLTTAVQGHGVVPFLEEPQLSQHCLSIRGSCPPFLLVLPLLQPYWLAPRALNRPGPVLPQGLDTCISLLECLPQPVLPRILTYLFPAHPLVSAYMSCSNKCFLTSLPQMRSFHFLHNTYSKL